MTSARLQIWSLVLGYVAAGVFWGTLAASLPALQARTGLGEGAFGAVIGLMALAAFPAMRLVGGALHRIEGVAIPLCMVPSVAGCMVLAFWPGLTGVVIGFLLTGGASGALDIALNNRTARVEADTGARLFNRTHAAFPAAMLAASAATGAARGAEVPLAALFCIVAAGYVGAALLEWRAGGHVAPAPGSADTPPARRRLRGPLLILALVAAAGAFQEAGANGWLSIYVETVREGGALLAGLTPAAFTLGLAAGRLLAHAVEHRLPATWTVRIAALLAAASFAGLALGAPLGLSIALAFVAGLGVGPIEPAVFRVTATRENGPARGRNLAAVTAVAYLGYLLSPPVLGQVAELLGWPALWLAAAAVACVAAVMSGRVTPD